MPQLTSIPRSQRTGPDQTDPSNDAAVLTAAPDAWADILRRLGDVRIAVLGDYCLDAYWELSDDESEASLETGLPIRRVTRQRYGLGGAGNVVANLVSLGVGHVRVHGVHGDDAFGAMLRRLLMDLGVDIEGLIEIDRGWATAVYAKPLRGELEQSRFDFGQSVPPPHETALRLVRDLAASLEWADVLVINQQVDGGLFDSSFVSDLSAQLALRPLLPVLVDARTAGRLFTGAMLKVNVAEAMGIVHWADENTAAGSDRAVEALASQLFQEVGQPVFVTRGDRGIVAADTSGVYRVPGLEVGDRIDPVGAGDTVVAVLAAGIATQAPTALAVQMANAAASLTVQKVHTTGTVTRDELMAAAGDLNYVYEPDLARNPTVARRLLGTDIEVLRTRPSSGRPSHVIFDHDGTLSTLRQGWESVMEPMMVEAIVGPALHSIGPDAYESVVTSVRNFIDRTTGVQTLAQMVGLAELVRRFKFVPSADILDEHGYKAVYNEALMAVVNERMKAMEDGFLEADDFHIKGALPFLEALRSAGMTLYLASGTDEEDVAREAEALGFSEYFDGGIYGSVGDLAVEAKRDVLDRILREHNLRGDDLATFGDGPVEMRETRKRGGLAVGVCSDERRRFGLNLDKRPRLIRGGAEYLIADFSQRSPLLNLLGVCPTAEQQTGSVL